MSTIQYVKTSPGTRTKRGATRRRHVPPVNVLSWNRVDRSERRRRRRTNDIKRQPLTYALAIIVLSTSSEMPSRYITSLPLRWLYILVFGRVAAPMPFDMWMWSQLGNTGTVHAQRGTVVACQMNIDSGSGYRYVWDNSQTFCQKTR